MLPYQLKRIPHHELLIKTEENENKTDWNVKRGTTLIDSGPVLLPPPPNVPNEHMSFFPMNVMRTRPWVKSRRSDTYCTDLTVWFSFNLHSAEEKRAGGLSRRFRVKRTMKWDKRKLYKNNWFAMFPSVVIWFRSSSPLCQVFDMHMFMILLFSRSLRSRFVLTGSGRVKD